MSEIAEPKRKNLLLSLASECRELRQQLAMRDMEIRSAQLWQASDEKKLSRLVARLNDLQDSYRTETLVAAAEAAADDAAMSIIVSETAVEDCEPERWDGLS